jgi:hypothetical protein
MRLYSFWYVNGRTALEPFTELSLPNDAAARQEALLTAQDTDRTYRMGPVKAWLDGTIVVKEGHREVVRVTIVRNDPEPG